MEKIGFVGTGAMGSALLSRLKLTNVSALAFDIAPRALQAARSEGAEAASSGKAVAQACTMIDVVVRTDQEVLQCVLGNDGILEGAAPGSLILLHSTIRPITTKKVAEAAADKRVNVIDACMTAVPSVVRQGGLTFLVGGQKAFFERAKPHLLKMAKDAVHMGPLGCGNVTKLFKNMVTASEALVVYEALQIAKAGGVSYKAALDVMQKTKSQHILDRWDTRYEFSSGELKFISGTNLYDKDLPLAAEVGKTLGAEIPVVEALAKLGIKLNGGKVSI
ncbi:MAG TPA: NAD(P)-dependent oxidoreductase [Candidatus Eisenbacteria bacterium]|jgi:3-hydroxyisobutyrate dehydrogenase-like beta-hydroxyacid dehydrogenase|nr:NAD(P)-dependent oxidoreductase [Candidatus Eisenbacteria bacterium]